MDSLWLSHLSTKKDLNPREALLLEQAARNLYPQGRYDEAKKNFSGIASHTSASEEAKQISLLGLTDCALLEGDMERALPTYTALTEYFASNGDLGGSAFCLKRTGWVHGTFNRFDEAKTCFDLGLSRAKDAGDIYSEAYVYYGFAMLDAKLGNCVEALQHLHRCEDLRASISDMHGVAVARNALGKMYFLSKDLGRSFESLQSSLDIFHTLGNNTCVAAVSTHIAALAADIQLEREPHMGILPGCSSGDQGESIRKTLIQLAAFTKTANGGNFISAGAWPG